MPSRCPLLLALVLIGCESGPPRADDAVGVPTPVAALDADFVQFEGRRVAVGFFLLEMRERVRAARGDVTRMPLVELSIPEGAPGIDGRWIRDLTDELHKAGIRYFALGG